MLRLAVVLRVDAHGEPARELRRGLHPHQPQREVVGAVPPLGEPEALHVRGCRHARVGPRRGVERVGLAPRQCRGRVGRVAADVVPHVCLEVERQWPPRRPLGEEVGAVLRVGAVQPVLVEMPVARVHERAAAELEVEGVLELRGLQPAGVIVDDERVHDRPRALERSAPGEEIPGAAHAPVGDAGEVLITQLVAKFLAHVAGAQVQLARLVAVEEPPHAHPVIETLGGPGRARAVRARGRGHELPLASPVLRQPELRVEPAEAVERGPLVRNARQRSGLGGALPVPAHEHAQVRALAERELSAVERVPAGAGEPRVVARREAGAQELRAAAVAHEQRARVPCAGTAGQLGAPAWIGHAPRLHQVHQRLEVIGPLEEERALLGIDDREAPVHVDHQRVGLDLAEVGVVGTVQDQRRRHRGLQIHTGFARGLVAPRGGAAARERRAVAERRAEHVRLERQLAPAARSIQPVQVGGLQHHGTRHAHAIERPRGHLVPRRDVAAHPQPPRPAVRRDAQDAKRHRHLRRPLPLPSPRRSVPDAVPLEVGVAPREDAVQLHAVGVHAEDVRALAVAVGVDVHGDVVAVQHLVARHEARVRGALRLAPDPEHDAIAVAQHAHRGGLVGRLPLARAHQDERARHRRVAPGRLVQHAVHADGARCRWRRERLTLRRARRRRLARCARQARPQQARAAKSDRGVAERGHGASRVMGSRSR